MFFIVLIPLLQARSFYQIIFLNHWNHYYSKAYWSLSSVVLFSGAQMHMHFKEDLIITLISYLKDLSKRLLLRKRPRQNVLWKSFLGMGIVCFKSHSHFYWAAVQQSKAKLTIDLQQWSVTLLIHQDFHWETPLTISLMGFCMPFSLKSVYFTTWISLILTKTLGCYLS